MINNKVWFCIANDAFLLFHLFDVALFTNWFMLTETWNSHHTKLHEQILRERNNNQSMRKGKFRITYSFLFNKIPTGSHKNLDIKFSITKQKNRGNENTENLF